MTPDSPPAVPNASSADSARHLAEVDARYDAHLSALREHAALVQAAAANDAAELAERADPEPPDPRP